MLYSVCFPKPAFFPLISLCKALWELPQYLQSSLASTESFSHVPQELSWLVMPHGTSHLMPSVPVRWHSPWLSCSFDVWTAFSFILPSLLGSHSSPLSCLPFLLAQVLQLLLFPSEAGSNLTLLWAGGWPKGCQTSLSASVIIWIHEDSCNLLNPWWNCATHVIPLLQSTTSTQSGQTHPICYACVCWPSPGQHSAVCTSPWGGGQLLVYILWFHNFPSPVKWLTAQECHHSW